MIENPYSICIKMYIDYPVVYHSPLVFGWLIDWLVD